MEEDAKTERDALLAFYSTTSSEITRYRDREWHNLTLFTAGIAAVIGFVLAQPSIAKGHPWLFDLTFVFLFVGNVFYTSYAHDRLTIQRNIQKRLYKALHLDRLKIDGFEVLSSVDRARSCCRREGWTRGFWSHLLPFFLADAALALFGIWLVHQP